MRPTEQSKSHGTDGWQERSSVLVNSDTADKCSLYLLYMWGEMKRQFLHFTQTFVDNHLKVQGKILRKNMNSTYKRHSP